MLTFSASAYRWPGLLASLDNEFRFNSHHVPAKSWQGQDVSRNLAMTTWELEDVSLQVYILENLEDWQHKIGPNLPWAEQHFLERVSGEPLNPPPSHEIWPHAQSGNEEHTHDGKFSHTYPERFWPKRANCDEYEFNSGIRYDLGDLGDVVALLRKDPTTRQAYLPIWFPEDTGAISGQRVPCTLGYHFRIRRGGLDVVYYIRSCDFRRHFRDDVYLAGRLGQWVAQKVGVDVGTLTMHISSFHIFDGDRRLMFGANDVKAVSR